MTGVAELIAGLGEYREVELPAGTLNAPGCGPRPPGMARLVVDFLNALGLDRITLVTNDSGFPAGAPPVLRLDRQARHPA